MKVFILEPTYYDTSRVKDYGTPEYVFDPEDTRTSVWNSEQFQAEVLESLDRKGYNPDTDYFAIVGHFVSITLAVNAVLNRYGCIQTLFFDSVNRKYVPRRLDNARDRGKTVSNSPRHPRRSV